MSVHERPGRSNEWYTPPYVFQAMRVKFDRDMASPGANKVPWVPANVHSTRNSPSPWQGFCWLNPPFGGRNGLKPWLEEFVKHGNGVCLVPDRTSAPWWQFLAKNSELILFLSPKVKFVDSKGRLGKSPSNGITLHAIGPNGRKALKNASSLGWLAVSPEVQAALNGRQP